MPVGIFTGGGASGSGQQLLTFPFGATVPVPTSGTLYMRFAGVPLSACPIVPHVNGQLRGASLRVDLIDAAREYDLQLLLNSSIVEILTLPINTLAVTTVAFSTAITANDKIELRLVRTSENNGKSTFNNVSGFFDILED